MRYRIEFRPAAERSFLYRVVYEIHRFVLLVLILAVGHRREVYRTT